MSTNPWVQTLTAVAATGNVTQCFPAWCPTGVNPATAVRGQEIRHAQDCQLHSITVTPDGTNGGILEIFDINGADAGADVSSADVITNAQLTSLITRGLAKLIMTLDFAGTIGSGPSPYAGIYRTIARGLGMRFSNAGPTGVVKANVVVGGCAYKLVASAGA
jgi:hypothetical protein